MLRYTCSGTVQSNDNLGSILMLLINLSRSNTSMTYVSLICLQNIILHITVVFRSNFEIYKIDISCQSVYTFFSALWISSPMCSTQEQVFYYKLRHQACSSAQRQVFRPSTTNSGIKVAGLLGMNRCVSFPLLTAPLSLSLSISISLSLSLSLLELWMRSLRSESLGLKLERKIWFWVGMCPSVPMVQRQYVKLTI